MKKYVIIGLAITISIGAVSFVKSAEKVPESDTWFEFDYSQHPSPTVQEVEDEANWIPVQDSGECLGLGDDACRIQVSDFYVWSSGELKATTYIQAAASESGA